MNIKQLMHRILNGIKVDLKDEFDRNFVRKGFFNEPWRDTKHENPIGSLMMRSGDLRRGMEADIESGESIRFTNSMPYARIHNEGGETHPRITPKMRAWAWAQYKDTQDAMYKGIALSKKETLTVKIPQRQFIGEHPEVHRIIQENVDEHLQEALKALLDEAIQNQ